MGCNPRPHRPHVRTPTHTTRQERVVTRRRDAAGRLETEERVAGGVADPHAFDAEWRAAAQRVLPRGPDVGRLAGGGGGGSGQQQQARLALPHGGGYYSQQQQQQQ